MINLDVDLTVIGCGPAGLSAAISAKKFGVKKILILDRNNWLGGILQQCIHDGFGVEEIGVSMTGPEYAEMYIKEAERKKIKIMKETMVLEFDRRKKLIAINKEGIHKICSKAIILATGCREKTRWDPLIPGSRPSGIYTAGVAQSFINLYNILPGKNVVILGSGDVGLIMARRLKYENVNVLGVIEILPYPTGLPRNVVQCLEDYDIPLFLNHTVTSIVGKERLEGVTISDVDKNMDVIPGSERSIKCDTLLLALGLIPENELARDIGIKIDQNTGGPCVNQEYSTSIPGFFACGNCLYVYDTVDLLSIDSKKSGEGAANYILNLDNVKDDLGKKNNKKCIRIHPGENVKYVVPQIIDQIGRIQLILRAEKPFEKSNLIISTQDGLILKKNLKWINPAYTISFQFEITRDMIDNIQELMVEVIENK